MPSIDLPVPESDKNIARQAVFAVVRQVMEITNIPKDTLVVYKGKSEAIAQHGSTAQSSAQPLLASTNMLTVEVIENFTPNGVATTATSRLENEPIFVDEFLDIMLRPIYSSNEMEIQAVYKSKSQNAAMRWRDDIRNRVSQMRDVNMHGLEYHYSPPREFIYILREIHKLREATDGYGDKFEEYLFQNSTTKLTEIANQSGGIVDYAVAESQLRIQGMFDFDVTPREITKGEDAGQWVAEFTYKFILDRPTACHFRYPIMVHNQLLDRKLIPVQPDDHNKHDRQFTRSGKAIHYFETQNLAAKDYGKQLEFRVPETDEFIPNVTPPDLHGVFSVLCSIDPTDKKYLLDLKDLGDIKIDSDIMEFIKAVEWKYLTIPMASMLHVSVYRHSYLANDRDFFVNNQQQVRCREDVSLRKNHRVLFSLMKDLQVVQPAALKRMKMFPKAAVKILSAMRATHFQIEALRYVVDLRQFVKDLPRVGPSRQQMDNAHVGMNTVMSGYVVARDGVRGSSFADAPPFSPRS